MLSELTRTTAKNFDKLFLDDVKALFLREKAENLGPYVYSTPSPDIQGDLANGEFHYYKLLSQYPDYYLYKEEIELIQKSASQIAAYVPSEADVIEFGPGTDLAFRNKTLPFLREIKQIQSYIPIDLCETYLMQSEEILSYELPEVTVKPIKTDFIKNVDIVGNYEVPVVFFKGSTVSNLSQDNCLAFLSKIAKALQPKGRLIVGIDANQSEASLKKAYDNEIVSHFILSTPHRIKRDLPISGFDPTLFSYEFNWVAEAHCVEHNVRVTQDQSFVLDGTPIKIKEGEKFHFLSSYKYPIDYFQNIAVDAGFQPLDYFIHDNKRMVIHVLEAK